MANSKRRCKNCHDYHPAGEGIKTPRGWFHSAECAAQFAVKARESASLKEHKRKKREIKPRSYWLQKAQQAFNAYIRARDEGEPCISCGRHHEGQWHAGHYRSVGSCPELRFEERNVYRQCSACNAHLSGNLIEYRKTLRFKFGDDFLDWLEGPHDAKHYTIEDLQEIAKVYRQKKRELDASA